MIKLGKLRYDRRKVFENEGLYVRVKYEDSRYMDVYSKDYKIDLKFTDSILKFTEMQDAVDSYIKEQGEPSWHDDAKPEEYLLLTAINKYAEKLEGKELFNFIKNYYDALVEDVDWTDEDLQLLGMITNDDDMLFALKQDACYVDCIIESKAGSVNYLLGCVMDCDAEQLGIVGYI